MTMWLPVVKRSTYAAILGELADAQATIEEQGNRIAELESALALTRLEERHQKHEANHTGRNDGEPKH
jgi:hypothetical protein